MPSRSSQFASENSPYLIEIRIVSPDFPQTAGTSLGPCGVGHADQPIVVVGARALGAWISCSIVKEKNYPETSFVPDGCILSLASFTD